MAKKRFIFAFGVSERVLVFDTAKIKKGWITLQFKDLTGSSKGVIPLNSFQFLIFGGFPQNTMNTIFTARFPNLKESSFSASKDTLLMADHFTQGQCFEIEGGSKVAAMGGSALHIFDKGTERWI